MPFNACFQIFDEIKECHIKLIINCITTDNRLLHKLGRRGGWLSGVVRGGGCQGRYGCRGYSGGGCAGRRPEPDQHREGVGRWDRGRPARGWGVEPHQRRQVASPRPSTPSRRVPSSFMSSLILSFHRCFGLPLFLVPCTSKAIIALSHSPLLFSLRAHCPNYLNLFFLHFPWCFSPDKTTKRLMDKNKKWIQESQIVHDVTVPFILQCCLFVVFAQ